MDRSFSVSRWHFSSTRTRDGVHKREVRDTNRHRLPRYRERPDSLREDGPFLLETFRTPIIPGSALSSYPIYLATSAPSRGLWPGVPQCIEIQMNSKFSPRVDCVEIAPLSRISLEMFFIYELETCIVSSRILTPRYPECFLASEEVLFCIQFLHVLQIQNLFCIWIWYFNIMLL